MVACHTFARATMHPQRHPPISRLQPELLDSHRINLLAPCHLLPGDTGKSCFLDNPRDSLETAKIVYRDRVIKRFADVAKQKPNPCYSALLLIRIYKARVQGFLHTLIRPIAPAKAGYP